MANDFGEALQKVARSLSPTEIGSTVARGRSRLMKDVAAGASAVKQIPSDFRTGSQQIGGAVNAVKSGAQKVLNYLKEK